MDRRREQPPAIVCLTAVMFIILVFPIVVINGMIEHDEKTSVACPRIATIMDYVAYYWVICTAVTMGFITVLLIHCALN